MSTISSSLAIVVDSLDVRRGETQVLHNVSAQVQRGTITGILGPSGCGKSTLIRSIVGTQIVESGSVTVLDLPAGSAALRNRVGYVTQSPSIYSDLTVTDNVGYFGALYKKSTRDIEKAIDAVGMSDHAGYRSDALSGGQRTRVSLACALVADPDLLVLDEPTVGLDPVLRADLWERFTALADAGTTLVVSSHVMDEAEHCERLLLLREGELIADDSPDALLRQTHTTDVESAFLELVR